MYLTLSKLQEATNLTSKPQVELLNEASIAKSLLIIICAMSDGSHRYFTFNVRVITESVSDRQTSRQTDKLTCTHLCWSVGEALLWVSKSAMTKDCFRRSFPREWVGRLG